MWLASASLSRSPTFSSAPLIAFNILPRSLISGRHQIKLLHVEGIRPTYCGLKRGERTFLLRHNAGVHNSRSLWSWVLRATLLERHRQAHIWRKRWHDSSPHFWPPRIEGERTRRREREGEGERSAHVWLCLRQPTNVSFSFAHSAHKNRVDRLLFLLIK